MEEITDTCGIDYLRIAKLINSCPKCNSPLVGKGYGTLSIDKYTITRACQCGYKFKYDMQEGKTTKRIAEAVMQSLQKRGKKK